MGLIMQKELTARSPMRAAMLKALHAGHLIRPDREGTTDVGLTLSGRPDFYIYNKVERNSGWATACNLGYSRNRRA